MTYHRALTITPFFQIKKKRSPPRDTKNNSTSKNVDNVGNGLMGSRMLIISFNVEGVELWVVVGSWRGQGEIGNSNTCSP